MTTLCQDTTDDVKRNRGGFVQGRISPCKEKGFRRKLFGSTQTPHSSRLQSQHHTHGIGMSLCACICIAHACLVGILLALKLEHLSMLNFTTESPVLLSQTAHTNIMAGSSVLIVPPHIQHLLFIPSKHISFLGIHVPGSHAQVSSHRRSGHARFDNARRPCKGGPSCSKDRRTRC